MNKFRKKKEKNRSDTLVWIIAAIQVLFPVLLIMICTVAIAYGIIHLFFFIH